MKKSAKIGNFGFFDNFINPQTLKNVQFIEHRYLLKHFGILGGYGSRSLVQGRRNVRGF